MTQTIGSSDRTRFASSDATPGRTTRLLLDVPDTLSVEKAWGGTRVASQIGPLAARANGQQSDYSQNVRYWPTGVWTLKPIQERYSDVQQTVDTDTFTYKNTPGGPQPLLMIYNALVAERTQWQIQGAPVSYASNVLPANDTVYQIQHTATETTWGPGLAIPAGGQPIGVLGVANIAPAPTVPIDRIGYSKETAPPDQAFFLRWHLPGIRSDRPDYICQFGFGQYCLVFKGDGFAMLWEYCLGQPENAMVWRLRASFQYTNPDHVVGYTHSLIIFPHRGMGGEKHIIVSGNLQSTGQPGVLSVARAKDTQSTSIRDWVYTVDPAVRGFDRDESPGSVTKQAPIWYDTRRDKRIFFTLQQVRWSATGKLTDQEWSVPVQNKTTGGGPGTITLSATKSAPAGTTLTTALLDHTTASADVHSTAPYVQFNFAADGAGKFTPFLYAYKLTRPPQVVAITPGQFETPVSSVSLNIGSKDLRSDNGQINVEDPLGTLSRLRARAEFRGQLVVDYVPPNGDAPQTVVLLDGYLKRPNATQRGSSAATFPDSSPRTYPAQYWKHFALAMTGRWERLTNTSLLTFQAFGLYASDDAYVGVDPLSGVKPPWKVTAAMSDILLQMGFQSKEIQIPDNPIRLFPGIRTPTTDTMVDANTNLAERLVSLARNYLGGLLIWDPNWWSDTGAWTLVNVPAPTATPLINFVGGPANPLALQHRPESYPVDGTGATVTTWVKNSYGAYPLEPENNHVWVMTSPLTGTIPGGFRFEVHLFNPYSYQVPGSSITPDPDSPHYSPFGEKVFILKDPTLYSGVGDDYAGTKRAVRLVARRLFDFTCRGGKLIHFSAPLVFLKDATHGRYRFPRFCDPVTWNGTTGWYIRSVHPAYNCDGVMMAEYEIEKRYPVTAITTEDTAGDN